MTASDDCFRPQFVASMLWLTRFNSSIELIVDGEEEFWMDLTELDTDAAAAEAIRITPQAANQSGVQTRVG